MYKDECCIKMSVVYCISLLEHETHSSQLSTLRFPSHSLQSLKISLMNSIHMSSYIEIHMLLHWVILWYTGITGFYMFLKISVFGIDRILNFGSVIKPKLFRFGFR